MKLGLNVRYVPITYGLVNTIIYRFQILFFDPLPKLL